MFDFIRNHQKLMMGILLLFITPAFVFVGVEGYRLANEDATALAVVGDKVIQQQEFDDLKRQQIEEAKRQSGGNFDPKQFDTPVINQQILDMLVFDHTLRQSAQRQYLTASVPALQTLIQQDPSFQQNGVFNYDTYLSVLAAQGLTEEQHEGSLRFAVARNQVLDPLLQGVFLNQGFAKQVFNAQLSGRNIRYVVFNALESLPKVNITPEDIEKHYKEHSAKYQTPAQIDVEYVVLTPEDVKHKIVVTAADIETYYKTNQARFGTPEERKARHILLSIENANAAGSAQKESEVKAKAEKIAAEVKANPERFAELAKLHSEDPGSSQQGGDLGFFGKGVMAPEFEQATFSLKLNEVSAPVKTQFGYHVIQVTDIKPGQFKPLEEVKNQIVDEIKIQRSQVDLAAKQAKFSDLAFEGGRGFAEIEQQLGLKTQSFKKLTQTAGPDAPEWLQHGPLLNALFDESSIQNRYNTKAMPVGNAWVSARVVEHHPAAVRPLSEVAPRIELELRADKARKETQAQAAKLKQALSNAKQKNENLDNALKGLSQLQTVSLLGAQGVPPAVVQAALKTQAKHLPEALEVDLNGQGHAVVWVEGIQEAKVVVADAPQAMAQYFDGLALQSYQEALLLAAKNTLGERLKTEIKKPFNSTQQQ